MSPREDASGSRRATRSARLIVAAATLAFAGLSLLEPAGALARHRNGGRRHRVIATRASAANVLRVGAFNGSPGQFGSIQAAVDAATPGDWVLARRHRSR